MPTKTNPDRPEGERGLALISVVWVILLLSLMVGSLMMSARGDIKLTGALEERAKAQALADAGIARAIMGLSDPNASRRWRLGGHSRSLSLGGGTVNITIEDEFGKIDLNRADESVLRALFASVTEDPAEADALASAVADWRDEDVLVRLNGAEEKAYERAGFEDGPRNGPFETVDELVLVLGVTPDMVRCLAPMLTVYSGRRTPDMRTAPAQVLAAIGLNGGNAARPGGGNLRREVSALGGRALTIRAEATTGLKGKFTREAVIRITSNRRNPYWIHAWRQPSGSAGKPADSCMKIAENIENQD